MPAALSHHVTGRGGTIGGGSTIGKSTASANVVEGTTTTVDAKLQIDRNIAAASLGVDLEIVNGQ